MTDPVLAWFLHHASRTMARLDRVPDEVWAAVVIIIGLTALVAMHLDDVRHEFRWLAFRRYLEGRRRPLRGLTVKGR